MKEEFRFIVAKNYQSAPTGLAGVTPTNFDNNDGKITGTTELMEYKVEAAADSAYTTCSATTTTGLMPGTYLVRRAGYTSEVDNYFPPGPVVEVVVHAFGEILGVTVPVRGATPVTKITDTDHYTGTVSWNHGIDSFDAGKAYTATITLTTKLGFTLDNIPVNCFTVAGAVKTTNEAGSTIIEALFPTTKAVYALKLVKIVRVEPDSESTIQLLEDEGEDGDPTVVGESVEEGRLVGLVIKPKDGMKLKPDTLKAIYKDGTDKEVVLKKIGDDVIIYLFYMPSYDVDVTAEFVPIE